jgi:CRP/FNR family transcriptional regulator, cyclic AMP receptor protein
MSHSALWYFEHFGLLQGLSDEQKQHVRQKSRMFEVKRGQPIYLLGDQSEHVYLVKTGAVKILGHAPEGCDVMLAVLTPGDIFGELALTDDASRDHRAEAADDSLLCEIPRGSERYARASRNSLERVRLPDSHTRSSNSRTSTESGDGEGVLIPLRLSQGDLGKLVGLTRETVNAILHVWREQGVVEIDRRCIRLRDPERLKRVR